MYIFTIVQRPDFNKFVVKAVNKDKAIEKAKELSSCHSYVDNFEVIRAEEI